jgi:hypothetical protein
MSITSLPSKTAAIALEAVTKSCDVPDRVLYLADGRIVT